MADEAPERSIADLLNYILETVVQVFGSAGVTLPSRQFITVGPEGDEPHSCEQLTVSLVQVYSGPPGDQAQLPVRCNSPRTAVVSVEVVRCLTDETGRRAPVVPTPAATSARAEMQMVDAWLLMDAGLMAGETYLGAMADVTAGPAGGGYQGMVLSLVLGIP